MTRPNIDELTVNSFGEEWSAYDQGCLSEDEATRRFDEYFAIFPWHCLPPDAAGADIGCGSGRWATHVAPRVGLLHCIDASEAALEVARRNLASQPNCRFHHASVDAISLLPRSLDFAYSVGVLHHVPDTLAGITACARLLKPGAPLLLYLYYDMENRPWWFRRIWKATDLLRRVIAHLPFWPKRALTEVIAATVYWPLARLAALIEYLGHDPRSLPLSDHRHDSFYTMRTDAFDRFGTRLEQRFSRAQIETMMHTAGLEEVRFSDMSPFWCAVGRRSQAESLHLTSATDERAVIEQVGSDGVVGARSPVAAESMRVSLPRRTPVRAPGTRGAVRALLVAVSCLTGLCASGGHAHATPKTALHHAPNRNFDSRGRYLPGRVGFNLADVSSIAQVNSLPDGVKALVWVGQCEGADAAFVKTVRPFIGNPRVFGFYLMDDPDPLGRYHPPCPAENLKAESDWIHTHAPGAKTFIVLMKMTSSKAPSFAGTYNTENTHVDLYGIDPYPCRTELTHCDYDMIDRYVAAAENWGIPRQRIVPVYQTFGGGGWMDDGGGKYVLPNVDQMKEILTRWGKLVPTPPFDFAYSWGSQRNDAALESSPELQALFSHHNETGSP